MLLCLIISPTFLFFKLGALQYFSFLAKTLLVASFCSKGSPRFLKVAFDVEGALLRTG